MKLEFRSLVSYLGKVESRYERMGVQLTLPNLCMVLEKIGRRDDRDFYLIHNAGL